jgi:hypothetical protein
MPSIVHNSVEEQQKAEPTLGAQGGRRWRRFLVVLVILAGGVGFAGIAVAVIGSPRSPGHGPVTASVGGAHPRRKPAPPRLPVLAPVTAYTSAQRAFPAFDRAHKAADVLPRPVQAATRAFARGTGMNVALARRILADRTGAIYLLPGRHSVCMLTVSPGGLVTGSTCSAVRYAAARGFYQMQKGASGITLSGVASARARSVTISVGPGKTATARVTPGGGYRIALPASFSGVRISFR